MFRLLLILAIFGGGVALGLSLGDGWERAGAKTRAYAGHVAERAATAIANTWDELWDRALR